MDSASEESVKDVVGCGTDSIVEDGSKEVVEAITPVDVSIEEVDSDEVNVSVGSTEDEGRSVVSDIEFEDADVYDIVVVMVGVWDVSLVKLDMIIVVVESVTVVLAELEVIVAEVVRINVSVKVADKVTNGPVDEFDVSEGVLGEVVKVGVVKVLDCIRKTEALLARNSYS